METKPIVKSAHKKYAPSSLYRVILCPASVQQIESLPESEQQSDSIYARRGTCAHAVSELCLEAFKKDTETGTEPDDFLRQEVENVIVDESILFGVNMYVNHMKRKIVSNSIDWFEVESKLDFSPIKNKLPPFIKPEENGGTMDFIGYSSKMKRLFVDDYKNGVATVEVFDNDEPNILKALNPQAMDYVFCAVAHYYKQFDIKTIEITIHQPNAEHPDGPHRSKVIPISVVSKWFKKIFIPTIEASLEENPKFVAGEKQCHYCPASHKCVAVYDHTCDNALVEFKDSGVELPNPKLLTDEQINKVLNSAVLIEKFLHSVKAFAHVKAEQGEKIEGWKLVRKNTHRKFVDKQKQIRYSLNKIGLKTSDYLNPPILISPSKLEQVLKSKGIDIKLKKKFFADYVVQPEGGTNLVPENHRGKPVQPAIEVEFAELIER